jgi:site-specific recombinase XerD
VRDYRGRHLAPASNIRAIRANGPVSAKFEANCFVAEALNMLVRRSGPAGKRRVRDKLNSSAESVVHSLRRTALTRLGEAGADAFTIIRIAEHSSIIVSQRYVHSSNDAMELAFERLGMVGAQGGGVKSADAAK